MADEKEATSVEDRIYQRFFEQVRQDSEVVQSISEELLDLHHSGRLDDSSKVAEVIRQAIQTEDETDAS